MIVDTSQIIEDGEPIEFAEINKVGTDSNGDPVYSASTTISGYGCPFIYTADEIRGTNIRTSDTKLLCVADSRPKEDWKCTVDSTRYQVMDVVPIRRSGRDVAYICQLRV